MFIFIFHLHLHHVTVSHWLSTIDLLFVVIHLIRYSFGYWPYVFILGEHGRVSKVQLSRPDHFVRWEDVFVEHLQFECMTLFFVVDGKVPCHPVVPVRTAVLANPVYVCALHVLIHNFTALLRREPCLDLHVWTAAQVHCWHVFAVPDDQSYVEFAGWKSRYWYDWV